MKNLRGRVTTVAATKTVLVEVSGRTSHPLYKKAVTKKKKYAVHDEIGVKVGDLVEFVQTRPISKRKRWRIAKVLEK